ncbi:MAG: hypothetical protein M5U29_02430 [Anaerolineae bacterium]|nr:hypothetical protein [Anaerolineae bacterium]
MVWSGSTLARWWRRARGLSLVLLCLALPACFLGEALPRARAGNPRQTGVEVQAGQPVSGTIGGDSYRHVYLFAGQEGELISIGMSRLSGDLDPLLLLTDSDGAILTISDDDGDRTDALIEFERLPATGRYFIIATRFGQEHGTTTGDFSLLVERMGGGPAADSTLAYGAQVLGRITTQAPLAFYFLRAQRGDVITISMQRTSGNLDPSLDLATPDGIVLVSDDDGLAAEGTLDAAITNYTIPRSDIYLIVATRFGREAGTTEGTFVLSVTQTPAELLGLEPGNARLIDYGTTLTGTISDEVPVRYFRFDAERGDVIAVTMQRQGGSLDPFVRVLDASLTPLAEDDNSGDERGARIVALALPQRGTYYIAASRSGEQTGRSEGAFTLQLSGRPGLTNGQALEIIYGATVSGLISDQVPEEEYVFVGRAGDVVRVTMERVDGDLDSLVTLYDSDRKQIAFDDDSAGQQNARLDQYQLPADGMYLLIASRFDRAKGTTSGSYLLTLELVRPGG